MKQRLGFVSNSSSSSFLIYGVRVDECNGEVESDLGDYSSIEDKLDELKLSLGTWSPEGFDGTYVGVSWSKVKDDETGKQFRERVQTEVDRLTDALGAKRQKCDTHQEAWYD